jgi:hypothetical protein
VFATKKLSAALIFALVFSTLAGFAGSAQGNPDSGVFPVLAMPVEYVNYTVTQVNGDWWAKIDGTYPIRVLFESGDATCVPTELPMVYPTPPNTTNFHVWVNGSEIASSDWDLGTHHTAIGDWGMAYCVISPVSEYFMLTIHYEHPVEVVNGSRLFLYDLNIADYLTELSNSSIAYFTVNFEAPVSDVRAYTTLTDSVWNPKNLTINSSCDGTTVAIEMRSVMNEDLAGDLVVMFEDSSAQVQEFPFWLVAVLGLVGAGLLVVYMVVYRRKR